MSILNRTTTKRAKAKSAVGKKKRQAKRWTIKKIVAKFVPKRALVIAGGIGAAGAGAVVAKKRKNASTKS